MPFRVTEKTSHPGGLTARMKRVPGVHSCSRTPRWVRGQPNAAVGARRPPGRRSEAGMREAGS